jgi:uncharacterized membrane protein YphA (DoxX/SURF4 family)
MQHTPGPAPTSEAGVPAATSEPSPTGVPTRSWRDSGWAPWVSTAFRLVLAGVFAIASLAKIGSPDATVRAVRAYEILPESLVHPVAYGLPYLELGVALLLLLGIGTRLVAVIALVMLVLFIAAVSSAGLRGLKIDCGCFGSGGVVTQTHYLREIARDSIFVLFAGWLVALPTSRLAVDNMIKDIV